MLSLITIPEHFVDADFRDIEREFSALPGRHLCGAVMLADVNLFLEGVDGGRVEPDTLLYCAETPALDGEYQCVDG